LGWGSRGKRLAAGGAGEAHAPGPDGAREEALAEPVESAARRLGGYKFRRQSTIESFIVDFLCPAKALIVEVDGENHVAADDARRDALLARRGYTTIRFTNEDVMANMDGVLTVVLQTLEDLPDRWEGSPDFPTPTPSPEGEGLSS
jgi:very-short-patch-repair endonuclease